MIVKSNFATGNDATHSFIMLRDLPSDWPDIKRKIESMYLTDDFIVQEFIKDDNNLVLKVRSFYDSIAIDYMDGINEMAEIEKGASTDFFRQPTTKVEDDPNLMTNEEYEYI